MSLAHEQARGNVEGEVQRRVVRLRDLETLKRRIRTVVDGQRLAWLEEERQIDAGCDEDDERIERDLPEQERPVIREDVPQRLAQQRGCTEALVDEANETASHVRLTLHHAGPIGPEKPPFAIRFRSASIARGS